MVEICDRCGKEYEEEPCEIDAPHETLYVCKECWFKVTLQVARRMNPDRIIIVRDE